MNTYNRKSEDYEYDYNLLLPSLAFNPDDGLLLGAIGQKVSYGFKKAPYAASNSIKLGYALRTSGFSAHYRGEFIDILRRWDFLLEGRFQTPLYATNFYGFGNETVNLETEEKWLRFARATYHSADDGLLHPDWDRRAIEAVPRDHRQLQDLWPYFGALKPFPTLAIRGELSEFLTSETLERMTSVKPDLRHTVVANRGHAPILDEPEAVSAIDDFLSEIDQRARR